MYGVNVASKCGYTGIISSFIIVTIVVQRSHIRSISIFTLFTASGYTLLSKIAKMKTEGVEVAIFPCNQVYNAPFRFVFYLFYACFLSPYYFIKPSYLFLYSIVYISFIHLRYLPLCSFLNAII